MPEAMKGRGMVSSPVNAEFFEDGFGFAVAIMAVQVAPIILFTLLGRVFPRPATAGRRQKRQATNGLASYEGPKRAGAE